MNDIQHPPRHDLDDAAEFFRQGDEGEFAERESGRPGSLAFVDDDETPDPEVVERQLARRARYTRYVTGLMLVLGLGTASVFAVRGLTEPDEISEPGLGVSAPSSDMAVTRVVEQPPRPAVRERGEPPRAVRLEAAKGEQVAAAPASGNPASSEPELRASESAPAPTGSTGLTSPGGARPTAPAKASDLTAKRALPQVSRAPVTPPPSPPMSTAPRPIPGKPAAETPAQGTPSGAAAPPAGSYRPPTLRFDD